MTDQITAVEAWRIATPEATRWVAEIFAGSDIPVRVAQLGSLDPWIGRNVEWAAPLSSGERALLRIAVSLASGDLGGGLASLDAANRAAVVAAVTEAAGMGR